MAGRAGLQPRLPAPERKRKNLVRNPGQATDLRPESQTQSEVLSAVRDQSFWG